MAARLWLPAERAETPPAGESGGGGKLRGRRLVGQRSHCRGGIGGPDSLCREPGRDPAQRAPPRHPAPRPARSIGGIVDKPGLAIALDQRLNQRLDRDTALATISPFGREPAADTAT